MNLRLSLPIYQTVQVCGIILSYLILGLLTGSLCLGRIQIEFNCIRLVTRCISVLLSIWRFLSFASALSSDNQKPFPLFQVSLRCNTDLITWSSILIIIDSGASSIGFFEARCWRLVRYGFFLIESHISVQNIWSFSI